MAHTSVAMRAGAASCRRWIAVSTLCAIVNSVNATGLESFSRGIAALRGAGLATPYLGLLEMHLPEDGTDKQEYKEELPHAGYADDILRDLAIVGLRELYVAANSTFIPAIAALAEIRLLGNRKVVYLQDFLSMPSLLIPTNEWESDDLRRRCVSDLGQQVADRFPSVINGLPALEQAASPLVVSFHASGDAVVALSLAACLGEYQSLSDVTQAVERQHAEEAAVWDTDEVEFKEADIYDGDDEDIHDAYESWEIAAEGQVRQPSTEPSKIRSRSDMASLQEDLRNAPRASALQWLPQANQYPLLISDGAFASHSLEGLYSAGPVGSFLLAGVLTAEQQFLRAAHGHTLALSALLHLARFYVDPSSGLRMFQLYCHGHCKHFSESEISELHRLPRGTQISHGIFAWIWNNLAALQPETPTPQQRNESVRLFKSDAAAESVLVLLSQAGVQVAKAFVASRVMNEMPLGSTRSSLRDAYMCQYVVDQVLPMVQDAVADSSVASASHNEANLPRLWEMHDDAIVLQAAFDEEHNIELVRQLAAEGDPIANHQLGQLLMFGAPEAGLLADQDGAIHHLQAAAQAGEFEAQAQLGMLQLERSNGNIDNVSTAHAHLLQAAERGSVQALVGLGYIYQVGAGNFTRNMTAAVYYLRQAAEAGLMNAHSNLAAIYLSDEDPEHKNVSAARLHLEAAAAADFPPAIFNLGLMEFYGWDNDGRGNCQKAAEHWINIARRARWVDESVFSAQVAFSLYKQHDVEDASHVALRQFLLLGTLGSGPALENAAFAFESSADFGSVIDLPEFAHCPLNRSESALPFLSGAHCSQIGLFDKFLPLLGYTPTEQRAREDASSGVCTLADVVAAQLYMAAARQGHPYAMKRVGDCFAHGVCRTASAEAAFYWYNESSSLQFSHASFELAQAYRLGAMGVHPFLQNYSATWVLLDYCLSQDFLAEWPVFFARVQLLWDIGASWLRSRDSFSVYRLSLPQCISDWIECAAAWVDDADLSASSDTHFKAHRSDYSSGTRFQELQFEQNDDDMVEQGMILQRRLDVVNGARYVVGPLPLNIPDRQMCTILARAWVLACALCVLLFLSFAISFSLRR